MLAPGCRNARDHKVLYREMRLLEDQIYALEDENTYLSDQLDSARRENDSLRSELGDEPASGKPRRPSDRSAPTRPTIELPESPARERAEPIPAPANPAEEAPPFDPSASEITEPTVLGANEDPNVSDVTFHRLLTGGYDSDGRPGDEGVSILLEPRNPRGELVRTPGDIEIAVVDPERGDGRVAQWRFAAGELAAHWERRAVGEGFFLELPWPNRPPDNRQLELIVTYRTPRGKRLVASRPPDGSDDSLDRAHGSASRPSRRPRPRYPGNVAGHHPPGRSPSDDPHDS